MSELLGEKVVKICDQYIKVELRRLNGGKGQPIVRAFAVKIKNDVGKLHDRIYELESEVKSLKNE